MTAKEDNGITRDIPRINSSRIFIAKLTVAQLTNKFFYSWNREVSNHAHDSPPLVPVPAFLS
jgi:hypothetical protein